MELVVSQEFFVEVNLPYSIRFGEILKLEVITFNYVTNGGDLNVELKINAIDSKNGDLDRRQFEFIKFQSTADCRTERIPGDIQKQTFKVPHRTGVLKTYFVRPLVNKNMTIQVEVRLNLDFALKF